MHPDLQFHRQGREHVGSEQGLEQGAPDLVVEVVSPSSRSHDRVRKLGWYRDIGVPEYWLVDPEPRTVERLVLDQGAWRIADALEGDAVFRPTSFPELEIPLAELWNPPGERSVEELA